MAIHLTGAISFQDLINEFNVPKPVSLSQMYAGVGYVPESNQGVPKSGTISLGNFYGATAAHVIDYNITADTFNLNSATIIANSGWDGVTPIILTINISAGIVLSSNSTSTPALTIQGDLPADSKIFVNNSGYIIGMGGAGASGAQKGYVGGVGIKITGSEVFIDNLGTIAGGGGGGGGALTAAGGGGRSGRANSAGGVSGSVRGGAGTFNSKGNGGSGGSAAGGGAGGDWGAAGDAGFGISAQGGGAGGAAVDGNSLITWVSEGTIKGSRLN